MKDLTREEKSLLRDYMRELGRRGGKATKKKHGRDHFKKMRRVQLEERPNKA